MDKLNKDATGPQAWYAADVRNDPSWILRLNDEAIAGFQTALEHAKQHPKPFLAMTQQDFPLPAASRQALAQAIAMTQERWGMCLVKGFPVDQWSEADCRLAYWGMGLHMGVGRTQNKASEIINDVRDAGGDYKSKGGRGYNTNAELDFHQDSADVVALLCRRTAKTGGTSKVISSMALRQEVERLRPDLIPVLEGAFVHSYQGTQDPSQPPYYTCPIFSRKGEVFAVRTNRKNTIAAQRDFDDVPRLTTQQIEALDLLDELMPSDKLCYSMELERGDLQLLNNYVTLHSRTNFEDFDEPELKRHLFRLWLAIPQSQALPASFEEYFYDTRAGSIRGGVRGSCITPEFLAYEERQAKVMGMLHKPWQVQEKLALVD